MDLPDSLKFVIVHCGTNNVGKDGPVDIVNALFLLATHIQRRKPGVKIFVSGLLPRDQFPSNTCNIIDSINKDLDLRCKNKSIQNIHFFIARIYVDKPEWITECQPLLHRLSSLIMERNRETLEANHRNHQRT